MFCDSVQRLPRLGFVDRHFGSAGRPQPGESLLQGLAPQTGKRCRFDQAENEAARGNSQSTRNMTERNPGSARCGSTLQPSMVDGTATFFARYSYREYL